MSSAPMVARRQLEFLVGLLNFVAPFLPLGRLLFTEILCVNELLHFICKQDPIHSSYGFFEKGFGALSRSQVFGKADSFRLF